MPVKKGLALLPKECKSIRARLRAAFMQDYHQLDIWNRAMDCAVAACRARRRRVRLSGGRIKAHRKSA
jgi:hypothetical protein